MKKNFKKDFKIIALVWAASFVLALLLYVILISPQKEIKKQITSQLAEKEKMYELLTRINQKQAKTELENQMRQWHDNIHQYVIDSGELADLTFDISKIAKDAKVDAFSITSQDIYSSKSASGGTYITEKQMKVEFRAGFKSFAAFVNAIERHRPVIFINEFSLANTEQDSSVSQINMMLSVYVKKKQGT